MNTELVIQDNIEDKIYTIRGMQVMLDRDLAELYGVETKHINQAVRNNEDKFFDDFVFQLTSDEFTILRSNNLTAKFSKTRTNPKVFTEQGIYMLATILKSKIAANVTVSIVFINDLLKSAKSYFLWCSNSFVPFGFGWLSSTNKFEHPA